VTYTVRWKPPARRAIEARLPEAVAAAALEFVKGALAESPYRVGKPLDEPYAGLHSARRGTYRVLYQIDDKTNTVTVVDIKHRSAAYRA
jgi:mRNA interferase RelE/StbE